MTSWQKPIDEDNGTPQLFFLKMFCAKKETNRIYR